MTFKDYTEQFHEKMLESIELMNEYNTIETKILDSKEKEGDLDRISGLQLEILPKVLNKLNELYISKVVNDYLDKGYVGLWSLCNNWQTLQIDNYLTEYQINTKPYSGTFIEFLTELDENQTEDFIKWFRIWFNKPFK